MASSFAALTAVELLIIGADAREEHVNGPSAAASRTDRASAWSWVAPLLTVGAQRPGPILRHTSARSRAAIVSRATCAIERGLVVGAHLARITFQPFRALAACAMMFATSAGSLEPDRRIVQAIEFQATNTAFACIGDA